MSQARWIDISIPNYDGMIHWPGDPEVEIRQVMDMAKGDVCNLTRMNQSVHTGTHMDSPRHFVADGASMSAWTPDLTIGPCRVIEIADPVAVRAAELAPHALQPGEIILLKTENSAKRYTGSEFHKDYVFIAQDAARLMVESKIRTVGLDYMSVGGFHQDLVETHVILLSAPVWVIEGINLTGIDPGNYELCCLPLKLEGSDGAPARALIRPRS